MTQLTYKGLPVPWVTRWTGEHDKTVASAGRKPNGDIIVAYDEHRDEDYELGTLWMRSHNLPGVGEPEWKTVHTLRQRRCMIDPRCQVCGEEITGTVPWLMPAWAYRLERTGSTVTTMTPPTCRPCIEIALEKCPHLMANETLVLDVFHYRPVAVWGDLVAPKGPGGRLISLPSSDVPLGYEGALGRQLIVQIVDYRKRRS